MRDLFLAGLLLTTTALVAPAAAQQSQGFTVPDNPVPAPAPDQPIPFSHKSHLTLGLECSYCHTNADPGTTMGLPVTNTCMMCHASIATEKQPIRKLQSYAASGETIPWERVYRIASSVTWSHRVHLESGLECVTCHGNVRDMDVMIETKSTRAMASCLGCHRAHEAATECTACHVWPTDQMLGIE